MDFSDVNGAEPLCEACHMAEMGLDGISAMNRYTTMDPGGGGSYGGYGVAGMGVNPYFSVIGTYYPEMRGPSYGELNATQWVREFLGVGDAKAGYSYSSEILT